MSKRRNSTTEGADKPKRPCRSGIRNRSQSPKPKVRRRPYPNNTESGCKSELSSNDPILAGLANTDNKSAVLASVQNQSNELHCPTYPKITRLTSDAWCPKQDPDLHLHLDLPTASDIFPYVPSKEKDTKVRHMNIDRKDALSTQHKDALYTDKDVLLGRGGMTNKHPGNQSFRKLVEETKPMYRGYTSKAKKKEVSQLVVDDIQQRGGRFLKRRKHGKDPDSPYEWVIASPEEARRKASQALRESNARTSVKSS